MTRPSPGPVAVAPTWRPRPELMAPGDEVLCVGGDLRPGTLLAAYRHGVFPMGLGEHGAPPLGWWSPDPRGVLWPARFRVSRSLRRAAARFDVTVDEAFDDVVAGCADPTRSGRWITDDVASAYGRLHDLGWAHSVDVWQDGDLVGGLYGVAIGGLFAGESMFHTRTDASKVALMRLVDIVRDDGRPERFIDMQWLTPHLASLGGDELDRAGYLVAAEAASRLPLPGPFLGRDRSAGGGEHGATPDRSIGPPDA